MDDQPAEPSSVAPANGLHCAPTSRKPGSRLAGASGALLGGGVLAGVLVLLMLRWQAGSGLCRDIGAVAQCLTAGTTALASAIAGLKRHGRVRAGWLCIAVGTSSWFAGQLVWTCYAVFEGSLPAVSAASLGYLGFPLLTLAGLTLLGHPRVFRSLETTADAVVVVLALTMPVWQFAIRPAWNNSDASLLEKLGNEVFPAADLVLITILVFSLLGGCRGRSGTVLATLITGIAFVMVSDLGYAILALYGGYSGGGLLDLGWFLAFAIIGLAARLESHWRCDYAVPAVAEEPRALGQLLPLALIPATWLIVAFAVITGSTGGVVVLVALAFCLNILVLVRQAFVTLDNRDMTRRLHRSHHQLEERVVERTHEIVRSEARFRFLTESANDGILTIDGAGSIVSCNPAARRILGLSTDEALPDLLHLVQRLGSRGMNWFGQVALMAERTRAGEVVPPLELRARRLDGSEFPVELSVSTWVAQGSRYYGAVVRDISERKRNEERLVYLAEFDGLTGLHNRRRLEQEVSNELARGRSYGVSTSLLFIDLDRFKSVNDSLGHQSGDDLLVNIAHLIVASLDDTAFVARLGGDEFAVLLPFTDGPAGLAIAEYLVERVREDVTTTHGREITTTLSIGVATAPDHGTDLASLLVHADQAMYKAKQFRDHAVLYDSAHDREVLTPHGPWEQRLRSALEERRLSLYLQPIQAARGSVTQFEALLRLEEEDELILPGEFIPAAEGSAVIHAIDRWVSTESIGMIARSNACGRPLSLEVNLSARSFSDRELLVLIEHELQRTSIDPSSLCFEITETAAIADIRKARLFVSRLKALGCRFALDDFGVGFSSFASLKDLDVDYVKIDGSFVRNAVNDSVDREIVRCIVQMAGALGKRTVAEFVTDEPTLQLMERLGVDYLQGYAIGCPMPEEIALARFAPAASAA